MRVARLFTEHPQSVRETYVQHLLVASGFGLRMSVGGIACVVHGLLPFLFCRTGSRTIAQLNEQMTMRRGAPASRDEQASSDTRARIRALRS